MGARLKHPPKVYSINWFRTNDEGKFIWPGFGDNIRVLKWVIDRVNGKVDARETPVGLVPHIKDLDLGGLDIPAKDLERLFDINTSEWIKEADATEEFLKKFAGRMPKAMWDELEKMRAKLQP